MAGTLEYAGNILTKAVAVKIGTALLKPRNLKKLGIGVGALAAIGAAYLVYELFSDHQHEHDEDEHEKENQSGSNTIVV